MLHQVIDVSEEGRFLYKDRGFLKVSFNGTELGAAPLEDVAVLMISARGATVTKQLLTELSNQGSITIFCGENYSPASIVFPVAANYQGSEILRLQINASVPFKKNIWQQIVVAKLQNQAKVLKILGDEVFASKLERLSSEVKSGDSDNREAVGAKLYFSRLFGEEFTRSRGADGINALLNYGYAVIRSSMARAIAIAGLTPALGIHHENRLNNFCLVDDLMEPYRAILDLHIINILPDDFEELTSALKKKIVEVLWVKVKTTQGNSPLFMSMQYLAYSFVKALRSGEKKIELPIWDGEYEKYVEVE